MTRGEVKTPAPGMKGGETMDAKFVASPTAQEIPDIRKERNNNDLVASGRSYLVSTLLTGTGHRFSAKGQIHNITISFSSSTKKKGYMPTF